MGRRYFTACFNALFFPRKVEKGKKILKEIWKSLPTKIYELNKTTDFFINILSLSTIKWLQNNTKCRILLIKRDNLLWVTFLLTFPFTSTYHNNIYYFINIFTLFVPSEPWNVNPSSRNFFQATLIEQGCGTFFLIQTYSFSSSNFQDLVSVIQQLWCINVKNNLIFVVWSKWLPFRQ